MKTHIVHRLDDAFLAQWQSLWDASKDAHFYNAPSWFLAYCDAYAITDFSIITVEENDTLQAVLPLIKTRQYGIKLLCCPGGKFLDKSSLLLREESSAILTHLAKQLLIMGAVLLSELPSILAQKIATVDSRITTYEASINYYVPLHPDPFAELSAKQRNKIANKRKHHHDHLRYVVYRGDPKGLAIAYEIESRSAKHQAGKATFTSHEEKTFFYQLIKQSKQDVQVDVLFYDNFPVVYQIGFVYKGVYQGVNTAYDMNYRYLSPGKLLLDFLLRRLQKEGFAYFDFSRGESVIKKEFTPYVYYQANILCPSSPLRGWWFSSLTKLRNTIVQTGWLYQLYLVGKKALVKKKLSRS